MSLLETITISIARTGDTYNPDTPEYLYAYVIPYSCRYINSFDTIFLFHKYIYNRIFDRNNYLVNVMIFTSQNWHTIDLFIFKELIFGVNEDYVCWVKKIQGHLQWNSQQKESIFSSVGLERANKHFYRYF